MSNNVLTIEINEIFTKICLVVKKSGGVNIVKSTCFTTPENCIDDGHIQNPEIISEAILNKISSPRSGFGNVRNAIFTLASSKIVSRKVFLPPVKANALRQIVLANAHDYFPIDLTNYSVAHTVVEKTTGKNSGYNVLVSAVPKNIPAGYVKLAQLANLQIESFDYNLNTQFELFKKMNISHTVMFISIGVKQSIATFMSGSAMLFQRIIPIGASDVIEYAQKYTAHTNYNSGEHESEQLQKSGMAQYSNILETISICKNSDIMAKIFTGETFAACVQKLCGGIENAADMFKTTFKSYDLHSVFLLGTCGEFAGLKRAISTALNINVQLINEAPAFAKVIAGKNAVFYAASAAAALNPLDKNARFAPSRGKMSAAQTAARNTRSAAFIMVFCIVAGLVLTAFVFVQYFNVQTQIDKATEELAQLSHAETIYDDYVLHGEIQNSLISIENLANNNSAELTAFLEEMEQKMPPQFLLLSATCDNFGVTLNVQTSTMEQAAAVLTRLRTFSSISEISTSGFSEATNELGVKITSFTVVCAYGTQ